MTSIGDKVVVTGLDGRTVRGRFVGTRKWGGRLYFIVVDSANIRQEVAVMEVEG